MRFWLRCLSSPRRDSKDHLSTSGSAALNEHIRTDDRSIMVFNEKNFTPGHFASRFPKNSVPPRRLTAGCRIAGFVHVRVCRTIDRDYSRVVPDLAAHLVTYAAGRADSLNAAFPSDAFAAVVPPLLVRKWEWLSVQRSELIEFQIEPCCFEAPAQTHPGNRLHSPRQGASCL